VELPSVDEVEVWAIDLASSREECDALAGRLSAQELRRAANMRVESARRRFIVARGSLRLLLARWLAAPADEIEFTIGEHGKPGVEGLSFNLSHSGEVCLVAVTRERDVGIDVELMRPHRDALGIARRYFTAAETEAIGHASDRLECFYRHWVAKEALLKATGLGLGGRLGSFEVALDPKPRIVHIDGDEQRAARWSLDLLELPGAYMAALVTDGPLTHRAPRRFDPIATEAA